MMAERNIEALRKRMTEGELQAFELALDWCLWSDVEVILKDCEARIVKEDETMRKTKQRELPILFNTEMVRAILGGRKTATRRLIRPRYKEDESGFEVMTNMGTGERWVEKVDEEELSFDPPRYINPPYRSGDILYVRETWGWEPCWDCGMDTEEGDCNYGYERVYNQKEREYGCYCYKASMDDGTELSVDTWHPSIHMPKAAARIWLKVTNVRTERLQCMSLDSFLSEGAVIPPGAFNDPENAYRQVRTEFVSTWNSTIKKKDMDKYGWEADPWVWVIEFKKCEKSESEG